jgi:hypothetical protein
MKWRLFVEDLQTWFLQCLVPIGHVVSEEKIEMWKVYKWWTEDRGQVNAKAHMTLWLREAKNQTFSKFNEEKPMLQVTNYWQIIWFSKTFNRKLTVVKCIILFTESCGVVVQEPVNGGILLSPMPGLQQ